jgi:hypothetical protein
MRVPRFLTTAFVLLAPAMFAQNEAAVRDSFEGQYVTVKIDMPATKDGIDIFPSDPRPLDLKRYASRIKAHGTALKRGDSVMVTLVKVKEKNIEFQLGGGGYGTVGDESGSVVAPSTTPKTKREKELEAERKAITDKDKKKAIDRELNDLRSVRTRQDARLEAEAAQAEEARKTRVRLQALDGGSRFNLWFPNGVPAEMLDPENIREALAEYVEFRGSADAAAIGVAAADPGSGPPAQGLTSVQPAGLRKGMTLDEVAALLGEPASCTERAEGALKVATCMYQLSEARAEGQFVDGVLLRYSITSQ